MTTLKAFTRRISSWYVSFWISVETEGMKDLVGAQLALVDYSLLKVITPADEAEFRMSLVREEEGESSAPELTSANVVASNLLSSLPSNVGRYVANRRDLSFVSFVTREENHETNYEGRDERERKEKVKASRWRRRDVEAARRGDAQERPNVKLDSMEEGIVESPLEEMDVDSVGTPTLVHRLSLILLFNT